MDRVKDDLQVGAVWNKYVALFACFFVFIVFCLYPECLKAARLPIPVGVPHLRTVKDDTFRQFIRHVWRTNPVVQAAQSDVARADAAFSQSRRPIYNPSINLEVERIRQDPQQDTYTVGFSQTIDLFNKQGARASVAQYALIEAKANLLAQRLKIAAQALKALANYRTAQAVVKLATRRTRLLRRFKEQNANKFKSGDIAQGALGQAALAYAQAISQQADESIVLMNAKQQLTAITQRASQFWPRLFDRLPRPLKLSPRIQRQWLLNLPIIRVYRARVAAARAGIRIAQTDTKPSPTVNVSGGTEAKEPLVNVGLSVPLFVFNSFKDQVRAANYQAVVVEQQWKNIYRQTSAALNGELAQYQILYDATNRWEQASKDSLDHGVKLLSRLWLAGELNTTDYLVQLKQRLDSQIAGVKLRGSAWQQWFSLMETSGKLATWLTKT